MTFNRAVVSTPDKERIGRAPHGSPMLIHATAAETGGVFGMWETFVAPGKGPAPHTHTRETEVFRVISGSFRFWCGGEVFEAPTGTVVTLPPHVPHHWKNVGDTPGQVMAIVSPAGAEQLSSTSRGSTSRHPPPSRQSRNVLASSTTRPSVSPSFSRAIRS